MLRNAINDDLYQIETLALQYDNNFKNHYQLQEYLKNPIYKIRVIDIDNQIVGFIIAQHLYEIVEILLIYIDANYRRKGYASSLINSLCENDVDNLLLEVSVSNDNAISLYKKLGFEVVNIRKGYYNGIDGLVMKKEVK